MLFFERVGIYVREVRWIEVKVIIEKEKLEILFSNINLSNVYCIFIVY